MRGFLSHEVNTFFTTEDGKREQPSLRRGPQEEIGMGSIRTADRAVIESMLSQVSLQRHQSITLINGFINPSIPSQ